MPRTYLAFDYGTRRIGLAVGNDLLLTSQPLPALDTRQLHGDDGSLRLDAIKTLIRTWQVNHLVFGLPLNAEGEDTALSRRIRDLGNALSRELGIAVSFADERYTSGEADRMLREHQQMGKRFNRKMIALRDSVAAQLILEAFFSSIR